MSIEVETPTMQEEHDVYNFAVFDPVTKQLMYSKYNFDFEKFRSTNPSYNNLDKNGLFYKFLVLNGADLWKPFVVKEEYKEFFLPITQEIRDYFDDYNYMLWGFNFLTLTTYITWNTLVINEFNLIKWDYFTEVPNLIEFLYTDDNGIIYSKYNFNFESYSQDFNIHGSKLAIFCDLLIRLWHLSGNAYGYYGYKRIPNKFKPYFYTSPAEQTQLSNYLNNYSIYSIFENISQSVVNIDYNKYLLDRPFLTSINDAKKHFLKYGQFQQDIIHLVTKQDDEIMELSKSICSVINNVEVTTGFLIRSPAILYDVYRGVQQIFLVTCYHTFQNANKEVFFANCFYNQTTNIKLMFRVIGYDKHTDLLIGMYDSDLDYNKSFFPENVYNIRNTLKNYAIYIYGDLEQNLGQEIYTIGNPGLIDNDSFVVGKIMDPLYSGNFTDNVVLASPPTILTDLNISRGQSGSPFFIRGKDNLLKCIGMINTRLGDNKQFSTGISSNLFRKILSNGIATWFSLLRSYSINDIENITFYIQEIYPKKWLGVTFSFYHYASAVKLNSAFVSLPINGGIVINNFILGFNTIKKQFLYNYNELSQQGVIKIDTPLLKTKMYNRFILNGKVPILLKAIKVYDAIRGVYKKFTLGKYKGQYSMDVYTYGNIQKSTVFNDPKYTNLVLREYSVIEMEYSYFDGLNWLTDTELVGGNDSSWFNEYSDSYGHKFLQHKFELPNILTPYLTPFGMTNKMVKSRNNNDIQVDDFIQQNGEKDDDKIEEEKEPSLGR